MDPQFDDHQEQDSDGCNRNDDEGPGRALGQNQRFSG